MADADLFDDFDQWTLDDLAQLLWQRSFDPAAVPDDIAAAFTAATNSPSVAGDRMRAYLAHLADHPVSRTRDLSTTYRQLAELVGDLSPLQAYVLRNQLGKNANEGYERVPDVVELQFPRDHALKQRAQTGWHFFVGSCWDEDGRQYGVEFMFFGIAQFPPEVAASYGLSDLDNQLIEIQLAISEEGARHHQAAPILVSGTSGLITATAEDDPGPFAFRVGRNAMVSELAGELFPMRVQAWGLDKGVDPALELAIDLVFSSGQEIIEQGDHGALPSVDGVGTFYYSIPEIRLDPDRSTLRLGDRTVRLVRGEFWFDHQWGYLAGNPATDVMRAADNLADPEPEGWDWFMAQFVGNRQLTVASAHKKERAEYYRQDGDEPPPTMEVRVGGKYRGEDGDTAVAWGTLRVTDWVKAEHSPDPDRYPATHTWHPNRWEFTFDDLPDDIAAFTMEPIVEGGQSAFFANGAQICEGAVRLIDPTGTRIGNGFAESVAYADCRRNKLRLAGLPVTEEMVDMVEPKGPPFPTRVLNLGTVLVHHKRLGEILASAKGLEFMTDTSG